MMVCPPRTAHSRLIDIVERAAVGASLLCLIHCAGLPLLLALLPTLSRVIAFPASLHLWLLAFAVPTSGWALLSGYRRHRAWPTVALGAFGLGMLALGGFFFAHSRAETPMTIVGSLALAAAHVGNWRLRRTGHSHG